MLNSLKSQRSRIVLAVALVALAAGVVAITASARPERKLPAELRVVTRDVGPGGGADVPPQGDSIGDSDTFTNVAIDPKTGKTVGKGEIMCVLVDIAKPGGYGPPARNATYHCSGISHLPDGELMFVARVHFDGEGRPTNDPAAIVGGTGRYAGARGWATSKPMSGGRTLSVLHFVR